jgi:cytochrome P450
VTELFDPFAPATMADPYPAYRVLRDERPVHHNVERGFYALSRYQDVLDACGDWERYSSEGDGVDLDGHGSTLMGAGNVVETDPPLHEELRRVIRRRFTPKAVAAMEPAIRERVRRLRDDLRPGRVHDVVDLVCARLPADVVGDLLGVPPHQRAALFDLVARTSARDPGRSGIPERAVRAAGRARELLAGLLDERLEQPRDDLVSAVAHGVACGRPLTREQRVGLCYLMLSAGTFSTKNLLTTIFWHLGRDAALRADVVGHPGLSAEFVEEILRFDAPLQNLARTTTAPVTLHGTTIPAGARVVLLFGSANRDERVFTDPDTIDVRRPRVRNLAFGGGIHNCIGAPLARLEARIVVEDLLPALGGFTVEPGERRTRKQNERGFERLSIRLP